MLLDPEHLSDEELLHYAAEGMEPSQKALRRLRRLALEYRAQRDEVAADLAEARDELAQLKRKESYSAY